MVNRPRIQSRILGQAPFPGEATWCGNAADSVIDGVCLDSRRVRPGDLYAALPGATTHGARFAAQALAAGAMAVLTDPAGQQLLPADAPAVIVSDPRGILGRVSAWVYRTPPPGMELFGLTGTNGKTTMSFLLEAGLAELGRTTGVVGTTGVHIEGDRLPSARTTPESPDLHALLALMAERGVSSVAVEVSSHALSLGRVDGLIFDVATFTNLSRDHLDFHKDMADYFAAKAALFTPARSRRAVVCVDDHWGRELARSATVPVTTYSASSRDADWQLTDLVTEADGRWRGRARGPAGELIELHSSLPGGFNHANVLGSLVTLVVGGHDPERAARGIGACRGVPGRMQRVPGSVDGPTGIVDYAHTPDAVARAIAAVRQFTAGRVLVVLGCGGDRDPEKRPLMGDVAARGADLLIVTDDNPRSEDPAVIRRAMLAGAAAVEPEQTPLEVSDRGGAISLAVERAHPEDCVLVLGKGHEQGQEAGGVVHPFDDRDVLAAALARRGTVAAAGEP